MEEIIDLQGLEYCSFKKKEETQVILINGDNEDVLPKIKEKTVDFIFCFDDKTELLTKEGWKNIKDIKKNDFLLSREPNTKKIEYVKNIEEIQIDYNGYMYSYEGKNISIFVSENHKLFMNKKYYYYDKNHNLLTKQKDIFIEAKDLFSKKSMEYNFISADGIWEGTKNKTININGIEYDKIKFARLLGIFLTDGYVNNKTYSITISQTKQHICNIIEKLLNDLCIKYYKYKQDNGFIYHLSQPYKTFGNYFNQFYLKTNRYIPQEFKDSNVEVLNSLLEGILDGDSDKERRRIYLSSKKLCDDIMEIAYKIGKSANYHIREPKIKFLKKENRYIKGKQPYYCISINNKPYLSRIYTNEKKIKYNGKLYCCYLEKWHTVLMRRNGKCIWIRQCDPPYSMDMKGGAGKSRIAKSKLKQKKDILDLCFNFNYEFIFNQCDRIIKKKNYLFFCSDRQLPQYMNKYPEMYRVFVWNKTNAIPAVNNTMWNNLEFLIYIREQGAYFNNDLSYEEKSKLITTPIMDQSRIHPTEKPQKVLAHWIKLFSKPNDIVLDMFSGSASTAMTCKLLGRKCICIEKNTKFYQSSKKRLEDEFYNKFDF